MSALNQFETFLERLMEGGFTRLLQSQLQPVEVAKKLARAMEQGQRFGPSGEIVVPNQYDTALHPDDLAVFADVQTSLERELAEYLARAAVERGFRPRTRPSVRLLASPEVGRREVRIDARLTDARPTADAEAALMAGLTAPMRLTPPVERPMPPASLVVFDEGGELRVRIERLPLGIGRALDNDLVLEDLRVSRHHAQIKETHGRFVLVDLESTNGTFVNGQRVREAVLAGGDRVSLGGVMLRFQEDPAR